MRGRGAKTGLIVVLICVLGCSSTPPTPTAPGQTAVPTASGPTSSATTQAGPTPSGAGQTPAGDLLSILDPPQPSVPPAGPPSSEDLITAALDAGQIDAPTADLYQIWAMFGDTALPAQYAGAGTVGENLAALTWPVFHRTEIPDDIYAQMEPYLVRPADQKSAFFGGNAPDAETGFTSSAFALRLPKSRGGDVALEDCNLGANRLWATQTATVPIKVWSRCVANYSTDIDSVVATLGALFSAETKVMGRPLPDGGVGGDDSIDVYIVDDLDKVCPTGGGPADRCFNFPPVADGSAWPSEPFVGLAASGFIAFPRSVVRDAALLRSVAAHELFHVLEFAHNATGMFNDFGSYWMVEASAKWAETEFARDTDREYVHSPFFTNQFQHLDASLNLPNVSAKSAAQGVETGQGLGYRSYIWPFFMEQENGNDPNAVGAAWRALEGASTFSAADAAMDSNFSFGEHFADFAVRNLDRELPGDPLKKHYWDMDANFPREIMPYGERRAQVATIDVLPRPTFNELELTLAPLTSRYRSFRLGDTTTVRQIEIDLSDLGGSGGELKADAVVQLTSGNWERRTLDHGLTKWCRDEPADDIQAFFLILSNASFINGDKLGDKYKVAGRDMCDPVPDLSGWVEYSLDQGGYHFSASATDVAWKLVEGTDNLYEVVGGTVAWTYSGSHTTGNDECTASGAGSESLVPDDLGVHEVELTLGKGITDGMAIGHEGSSLIIFWGDAPTYAVSGHVDLTQRTKLTCTNPAEVGLVYTSLFPPSLVFWLNEAITPVKIEGGKIVLEGESGTFPTDVMRRWHFEGKCPHGHCPGQ